VVADGQEGSSLKNALADGQECPSHEEDAEAVPWVDIPRLEQLWFQVAGTLCNLACRHCFISCHPGNRSFGFLSLAEVERRLEESVALGVREYYFTGGEPFLNPSMTDMLVAALRYGPATVLTNATVLRDEWLVRLRDAARESIYSLEFRVSIDGVTAEQNDPIRGDGTFQRAMQGVQKLVTFGFLPIITAVRTWGVAGESGVIEQFLAVLRDLGYERPRLKIIPALQLGAEESRTHGYGADDRVTCEMIEGFDLDQLVCHSSRIVTDRGVHVCPILIEVPDSLLDQSLAGSLRPFALRHGACTTCYQYGAICSNSSVASARGSGVVE
jgi:MoaA/NifB/PqqE/SkfB family radical SAM enzyme